MGRLGAGLGLLLLAAACPLSAQEEPSFHVDVRLVRILATVKDNTGKLIGDLAKQDFDVFDNGVRQELAVFEHHTEQPLSIAVMIDTSASTNIDLRYEVESVSRFFRALFKEGNPDDSAALFAFDYETTLLADFTHRFEVLDRNLKGLRGSGGTSMYDAITLVTPRLEEREGRHVIILVTDGGDTTSSRTFHQALEAVQRADAVMYPILVVPIKNDPGRNTGGENALATLAEGTGGRVFAPTLGKALDQAFAEILRDLRTQYLLGYYPRNVPATKEPFHRIEIKLKRPDLRVSARSGYYGDSEEPANAKGWRRAR
ncbi:MAG: VWA domain-containing protein [Acidobacteriota bacterium]